MTDEKKLSSVELSEPTEPALLKTRIRPLTVTRNCDGPTAPMLSGGTKAESEARVAPVKLVPTESFAPLRTAPIFAPGADAGEPGLGRRRRRASKLGRTTGVTAARAPAARWAPMIADVVRWAPAPPVQGLPTWTPVAPDPPRAIAPAAAMTTVTANTAHAEIPNL